MNDISYNLKIECTVEFIDWVKKLDRSLKIRVDQRLQRLANENPGQHKRFDSILEIKWTTGAMGSFRIHCAEVENLILILGGHKDTQVKDVQKALRLLKGVQSGKTRVQVYE